jgi:prolyl-tRNA synthetase
MADRITPRKENYSQWYVDIVIQGNLADYAPVKGCMVIRPRGYALWERMREVLDGMFKDTGHVNAYFPLLIPEGFIKKEAEHVEGFSPELAVVTHAGGEELEEPLVLRPTSETIIWSMYKKWIQSYRDLPLLINQWANVIRWEKRTRLFLRTTEFLWQEGHTAHETAEDAEREAMKMLDVYRRFAEEYMAIPVLTGRKSDSEKFAGAVTTYAIEAMMQDTKALQAGTSHFLGQNFAKAFDVTFQNREGGLEHVWATSWGVSTRLIGALIMAHSDDKGLVIPPKLAPIEAVIIPIFKNQNKGAVLEYARAVYDELRTRFRVTIDEDDNNSPGWKFSEWELAGVPVRVEIGPRTWRGVTSSSFAGIREKKTVVPRTSGADAVRTLLSDIQKSLYDRALDFRNGHTRRVSGWDEMRAYLEGEGGFAEALWCGSAACEQKVKDDTKATIRVLPFDQTGVEGTCAICGKNAVYRAVFAKSY